MTTHPDMALRIIKQNHEERINKSLINYRLTKGTKKDLTKKFSLLQKALKKIKVGRNCHER